MNTGPVEAAEHVASGFVDSLKNQPLSLALVVMNLAMLVFFYFLLSTVATQREREVTQLHVEQREVRDMLAKCIIPERRSEFRLQSYDPIQKSLIRINP